ncbi:hypothetical protein E3E12_05645 [Formicincola oecophyllae]|uniref:EcsC family protein n=1 Tax=Formicincola oecophyllae TaxID=2558361 RepID=A0A4Y6U973_9PROT|nr:EcsC family protein [Formicincola oecophyllae]QDH13754.1 hypothetical protein E3E12_05645 [Formicincola oecophyllae]
MTASSSTTLPDQPLWRDMDQEATRQLHAALAGVEKERGTLSRLAGLMGGAAGQAAQLGAQGMALMPGLSERIQGAARKAIEGAYSVAILGLAEKRPGVTAPTQQAAPGRIPSEMRENLSQMAVAVSGALGGFGGFLTMMPDVGFTTLTIMREIAAIAQEEGEDLSSPDTRRACLEVFALEHYGTRPQQGEGDPDGISAGENKELGFFAARALLRGRPLVLLMAEVAGHYGLGLSRKLAAQMVPVAGALCGAALNSAFLAHYRAVARAHFTIRRLERNHGDAVRAAAEAWRGSQPAPGKATPKGPAPEPEGQDVSYTG